MSIPERAGVMSGSNKLVYRWGIPWRNRVSLAALLAACLALLNAVPLGADTANSHGLLWEVSRPGVAASHLFGTIHSEDPEVLQLASPVQAAFDDAHSVVLEVLLDDAAMQYSSGAMLLLDGRTLEGIVGAELFNRAARATLSRGIPELVLQRMKPWAVAVSLSVPVPETGQVLDLALYQAALQAGKPVQGLETIREQLDVFDTLPDSGQVLLLQDALENLPGIDAQHEELLQAYKRRDLEALMVLSDASLETGDGQLASNLQHRLIRDRNRLMAERMQPYLGQGRAFIAVGALHLPGADGLLQLLQQRGYTVRLVY